MGGSPISTLPPEVLHQILKYLPLEQLLNFGRTSKHNYAASILALQKLKLAILRRPIDGVLAYLSSSTFEELSPDFERAGYGRPGNNQITLSPDLPGLNQASTSKGNRIDGLTPAQYRHRLIAAQNAMACDVLSTPTLASLKSLTLHVYQMKSSALAEILATRLPDLQDLRLNFCHTYVHDTCLPSRYWTDPVFLEPSPIWNAIAGVGDENQAKLKLRKLAKLTVERAGITSFQLRSWIRCNPHLRELKLRNVAGVDQDFIHWLGGHFIEERAAGKSTKPVRPANLSVLGLENCASISMETLEDFEWLDTMFDIEENPMWHKDRPSTLQVLSFRHCRSVKSAALVEYLETKQPLLRQVVLTDGRALGPRRPKRNRSTLSRQQAARKKQNPAAVPPPGAQDSGDNSPAQDGSLAHDQTQSSNGDTAAAQESLAQGSSSQAHASASTSPAPSPTLVEPNTVNLGIQALSIDEAGNEDSDSSSSSSDESDSSSSAPFLRIIDREKKRRRRKYTPPDIIEPDSDAA